MSDNVFIRFVGAFDKTIPDFFEEIWSLTARSDNEVEDTHYVRANETRHQYYIERGSTGIFAWERRDTDTGETNRYLKIEYEDEDCNYYKLVLNYKSEDGKYRIAMPLVPTLEGPYDGPAFDGDPEFE